MSKKQFSQDQRCFYVEHKPTVATQKLEEVIT